jgi:hypothetical protein
MSSLLSTSQRGLLYSHGVDGIVERRHVDKVQQQVGALQVAQEEVAEARAFRGPFDETRDVGHDEALLCRDADHAQVRVQRGERVVGDLRPRIRDGRDERGLAGVGHAQQADVGEHAHLELQLEGLPRPAGCLLARRPVRAGLEVHVAEAAVAPLGQQHPLVRHEEFGDHVARFQVGDDRAHRHAQDDVLGGSAELVGAPAVLAPARFMASGVTVVDQGVEVAVAHGVHAAAATTIAAVRPTEGQELLAAKAHAAVAAIACDDVDRGFVNEFHDCLSTHGAPVGHRSKEEAGLAPIGTGPCES